MAEELSRFKQRFADAPWYKPLREEFYVLLLGAGGIGSWVGFCLSRIGVDFTVFDMDNFESHNLGGQFAEMDSIGKNKALQLKELSDRFTGAENSIQVQTIKFSEESPINDVVIAAFDNMEGRKVAFRKWVEYTNNLTESEKKKCIFIDGRLLAEDYQVYAVTTDRIEQYKETLFDDSEVEEVLCTLKATTHCSLAIASDIISILTNFATNVAQGFEIRDVPFKIIKNIPLFTYEIK